MPEQSSNNFSALTPDNNSTRGSSNPQETLTNNQEANNRSDSRQEPNNQEPTNQPDNPQESGNQSSNQDSQSSNYGISEEADSSLPEPLKPSPRRTDILTPEQVANLTHIPGVSRFKSHKVKKDEVTADNLLNQPAPEKRPESLTPSESAPGTDLDRETLNQIISINQEVYTSLQIKENPDNTGNPINLEYELQQGNILLPTQEEHETRINAGYTVPIIIPGHLTRESIISIFQDPQTYLNLNKQQPTPSQPGQQPAPQQSDKPIFISDQAQTDLPNTNSQINKTRPNQLYLTYFKPDQKSDFFQLVKEERSAAKYQQVLEQEQQNNPDLNLQGLTLKEYLTLQGYFKQTTQEYLDKSRGCLLLPDFVPDPDPSVTKPARCLYSYWYSDFRELDVYSNSFVNSNPGNGSRFQAMPEYEEMS